MESVYNENLESNACYLTKTKKKIRFTCLTAHQHLMSYLRQEFNSLYPCIFNCNFICQKAFVPIFISV